MNKILLLSFMLISLSIYADNDLIHIIEINKKINSKQYYLKHARKKKKKKNYTNQINDLLKERDDVIKDIIKSRTFNNPNLTYIEKLIASNEGNEKYIKSLKKRWFIEAKRIILSEVYFKERKLMQIKREKEHKRIRAQWDKNSPDYWKYH